MKEEKALMAFMKIRKFCYMRDSCDYCIFNCTKDSVDDCFFKRGIFPCDWELFEGYGERVEE